MKRKIYILLFSGVALPLYFISCRKEANLSLPPVAISGGDITVQLPHEEILLDGSSSYDPDGKIAKYEWTKISGPDFISILDKTSRVAKLKFLTPGEYQVGLTVTDDKGISDYDTVSVTILKYASGSEILLSGLMFHFDEFEYELFIRTNPRPDIFFDYPAPVGTYLNAELLFKLDASPTWMPLKPLTEHDPALAIQYLYKISGDVMFVIRLPADPELEGKPASVKLKFN